MADGLSDLHSLPSERLFQTLFDNLKVPPCSTLRLSQRGLWFPWSVQTSSSSHASFADGWYDSSPLCQEMSLTFFHPAFIHLRDGSTRDYPLNLPSPPTSFSLFLSSVVIPLPLWPALCLLSFFLSLSLLPLPPLICLPLSDLSLTLFSLPLSALVSRELLQFLTDVVGLQAYKNNHTHILIDMHTRGSAVV